MPLSLVSLNIEGNKHFEKFLPFLKKSEADVICFQEIFAQDVMMLKQELGMEAAFAPMTLKPYHEGDPLSLAVFGIAIFSRLQIGSIEPVYYYGDATHFPVYRRWDETRQNRVLLIATINARESHYVFATTHCTVMLGDGEATQAQHDHLKAMMRILDRVPEIILAGDFNAKRGDVIFDALAKRYTDNIPARYTTSIDGAIHRAGPLPFMVDGLFTSPHYEASNVELVSGLSDHCGIVADISKSNAPQSASDEKLAAIL